ncbi:MAG: hypothetical protein KJZ93_32705 [Caldilineaceae bacterium]|nr:hypothetical protein [Caldilineaceae bacterium]
MQTTTQPKTRRLWRKRWLLAYQEASGTSDDEVCEMAFRTKAEAMSWADANPVVPLWLDEREELLGDNGRVLGVISQRHDV